ncbi:protein tyrosine kinase [Actinacidiphila bryophytorum]|uniref:Serine/threonine protein kinase n=1 Tax=Actinacidiphila bryophytorum TaxID=1436133 RepID=A0A9W4GYJ5_9ACTN|nr:protein tyrosine kinase [Actinacidiphila bryophytorum]MBM9436551.1 protein tyrosine kinase [Actinacidiphila bryophytorum]MBN6546027.1 protein tyrosine kinase [Actinacidiphila bryophytorum]CAG7600188.1 Serine/threonine protein kinase [Actinacidiphila bryophytorum]
MDEYAGRVLADRYRLPRPPADEYELVETRAFDTYSGQEVLVRQVLLPEVVTAEYDDGDPDGLDDSARRALEAARAAAAIPDHPRLVQVFDIFVEGGSLWIASELVSGRPLAALLAERPIDAYRAAEVASDVLTALRALHAHGWTHRNVTAGTVLVCDDGRAMLGGLAAGAAQEALCGYDPLPEQVPAMSTADGAGDGDSDGGPQAGPASWHGPRSALEQERARQNRITVVGAVTERWAPEQAHPVHENWQLSPPVGPPADLWALGSLLFRSVQGHPPYPEENAAELVQMVCAEPPAFAEECGPLRPVVESLLRPDPEERPEAEELGGWLRSLIRSAPEPEIGANTVQVPTDPARLPVKRRKGELVRRRRREAADPGGLQHRRHARGKQAKVTKAKREKARRSEVRQEHFHQEQVVSSRRPAADGTAAAPRRLGARLLVLVLAVLVALVVFAVLLLPHRGDTADNGNGDRTVPADIGSGSGGAKKKPTSAPPSSSAAPSSAAPTKAPTKAPATQPAAPPPDLGPDFDLRTDPEGFTVAVHTGWQRAAKNSKGQVRYTGSDLTMTVVPGRDKATGDADDPLAYQLVEPELADFRASSWSSAAGLTVITVQGHPAAEGEYTWRDANGSSVYARNLAIQIAGRYHVILIAGPDAQRAAVQRAFDKVLSTYTVTSR